MLHEFFLHPGTWNQQWACRTFFHPSLGDLEMAQVVCPLFAFPLSRRHDSRDYVGFRTVLGKQWPKLQILWGNP